MIEPNENPTVIANCLAALCSAITGTEITVAHFVRPLALDFSIWNGREFTVSDLIVYGRLFR
jgi:hypothetical protein